MNQEMECLLHKYPELSICAQDVLLAFEMMKESYQNGGKLLICGNGGSASDSEHIVGELMKGFMSKRSLPRGQRSAFVSMFGEHGNYLSDHLQGALPAISLVSHSAFITAYANDVAADMVFAQQVHGYGRKGDILLGLSTSGNSKNVVHAAQVAKVMGIRTVALTGGSGGLLKDICDIAIRVSYTNTPDIQERHLPIYHALCIMLEKEFFPYK
jgi:D-sedoheptulose 7-phosphate isomerase